MKNAWPLQEAWNRFSEAVERAHHEGPQFVTRDALDLSASGIEVLDPWKA